MVLEGSQLIDQGYRVSDALHPVFSLHTHSLKIIAGLRPIRIVGDPVVRMAFTFQS
jgi:hypothetical protein